MKQALSSQGSWPALPFISLLASLSPHCVSGSLLSAGHTQDLRRVVPPLTPARRAPKDVAPCPLRDGCPQMQCPRPPTALSARDAPPISGDGTESIHGGLGAPGEWGPASCSLVSLVSSIKRALGGAQQIVGFGKQSFYCLFYLLQKYFTFIGKKTVI